MSDAQQELARLTRQKIMRDGQLKEPDELTGAEWAYQITQRCTGIRAHAALLALQIDMDPADEAELRRVEEQLVELREHLRAMYSKYAPEVVALRKKAAAKPQEGV